VGYSLETAIADLVDNSIAARAKHVEVVAAWNRGEPVFSLVDDGEGMNAERMVEALRFGGSGPDLDRAEEDLGRFGLGLKTASLSQCRRLTVASIRESQISVMSWDLDHLRKRRDAWELIEGEYTGPPEVLTRLSSGPSGTAVIWEKVDFGRDTDRPDRESFLRDLEVVERHLAMVFHRFLATARLTLKINGAMVEAWDPFLQSHEATIPLPEQRLKGPGGITRARGFVLPHRDRFRNDAEFQVAGGPEGWNSQQGLYIYRKKRLLIAGGWLGLGRKAAWTRDEASRLARVRVDIPASADRDWRIDIRKAVARPPDTLRKELQRIAEDVRSRARAVFIHRGAGTPRVRADNAKRLWEIHPERDSKRYGISRSHDLVELIGKKLGRDAALLECLLDLAERTVPIERVWLDVTDRGPPLDPIKTEDGKRELVDDATAMLSTIMKAGVALEAAIQMVLSMEPFSSVPDLAKKLNRKPIRVKA